jgi:DNA polymerase-3 subunit alpha
MINAEREPFLEGASANGVKREVAEHIFADILKFGGYAFNKAHSTGYAVVAFQTAFLKCYYPVEFMAALLTYESGNTDKIAEYLDECRRVHQPDGSTGIPVRAPDVNESEAEFTVAYPDAKKAKRLKGTTPPDKPSIGRGEIRFGLAAISGIGHKAVQAICEARRDGKFRDLFDFCERVDLTAVNKSVLEALIKAGAFDSTVHAPSADGLLEEPSRPARMCKRDRRNGQLSIFGGMAADDVPRPHIGTQEWTDTEMLAYEKATLGFTSPSTARAVRGAGQVAQLCRYIGA